MTFEVDGLVALSVAFAERRRRVERAARCSVNRDVMEGETTVQLEPETVAESEYLHGFDDGRVVAMLVLRSEIGT